MRRKALLMGGHGKTRALARSLLKKGYDVCAVSEYADVCRDFCRVEGLEVICGDATEVDVLDQAGASTCDVAIALSNNDAFNLIACELCEMHFGVPKSVSIVQDSQKAEFFRRMGVDATVSVSDVVAGLIEQQTLADDLASVIPIENGRVEVREVVIPAGSPDVGKTLAEVEMPSNMIAGCILRGDQTWVPNGQTQIMAGDRFVLICGRDVAGSGFSGVPVEKPRAGAAGADGAAGARSEAGR